MPTVYGAIEPLILMYHKAIVQLVNFDVIGDHHLQYNWKLTASLSSWSLRGCHVMLG